MQNICDYSGTLKKKRPKTHKIFCICIYYIYFCAVIENVTIPCSDCAILESKISELQAVVKQLEDKISLISGGRSSRTSSTAPSHDIGHSNHISLRTSSGKKSGGQSGHAGSTLSFSNTPDEKIDHKPRLCGHCRTDLQETESAYFTRRQMVEIPPVVLPQYFEHRPHVKTCPECLLENRGVFPDWLRSPIQYGPRVEAMAGYL